MNIGIVGGTGMVGKNFISLLEERSFPVSDLKLFSTERSAGRKILFQSKQWTIQTLTQENVCSLDIVFFSAGEEVSRKWAPEFVKKKAVVIDNSSAFRMKEDVPLVVPEVNSEEIFKNKGIIANPNCSTIQLVVALKPLDNQFCLESVNVSTYQSLSGAGNKALKTLKQESLKILNKEISLSLPLENLSNAFNCVPQIGSMGEGGFFTEELKLMRETKKILQKPDLKIAATAVRVPTFNGHGEAVTVHFKDSIKKADIMSVLESAKGIQLLKDAYPHQRFVDGQNDVYVSRLRPIPDSEQKNWMMWIMADNLKKGAALNAIQVAELFINSKARFN